MTAVLSSSAPAASTHAAAGATRSPALPLRFGSLGRTFGTGRGPRRRARRDARRPRRRGARHPGCQRLRQVDAAAHRGRARHPHRRRVRIDGPPVRASTPAVPSPSRSRGCCRGGRCRPTSPSACRRHPPGTARRVARLLDLVGLTDFAHHRPREVSGGMAQRTSLARALARDPGVLLLDEPFGALDALTRLRMQDLLLDVHAAAPTTVLLVTHDVDEALQLADRVILLGPEPGRAGATIRQVRRPCPASARATVGRRSSPSCAPTSSRGSASSRHRALTDADSPPPPSPRRKDAPDEHSTPARRTARSAASLAAVARCVAATAVRRAQSPAAAAAPAVVTQGGTLNIDFATYNPLSLIIKQQGWLEAALADQGIAVNWVQSAGSNKANEALRAGRHRRRLDGRLGGAAGPRRTARPSRSSTSTPSPSGRPSSSRRARPSRPSRTSRARTSPRPRAPTPTSSCSRRSTRPASRSTT